MGLVLGMRCIQTSSFSQSVKIRAFCFAESYESPSQENKGVSNIKVRFPPLSRLQSSFLLESSWRGAQAHFPNIGW